jgi:hypothetical protein
MLDEDKKRDFALSYIYIYIYTCVCVQEQSLFSQSMYSVKINLSMSVVEHVLSRHSSTRSSNKLEYTLTSKSDLSLLILHVNMISFITNDYHCQQLISIDKAIVDVDSR